MKINSNWEENLSYGLSNISLNGLILEFGVNMGKSIRVIANKVHPRKVYGFDSFEGLPEPWVRGEDDVYEVGHFAMKALPKVPGNTILIKGFFDESLVPWLDNNSEQIAFLHIDSDLYSSAKYILSTLNHLIVPDTIIVFDEYQDWHESGKYEYWKDGEYKAHHEWIQEYSRDVEMISRDNGFAAAFKVIR